MKLVRLFAILALVQAVPAAAQTLIKISSPAPVGDPAQTALETFATRFTERTKKAYTVKIFPSSQLGIERQVMQGLQSGAIEMAYFGTTSVVNFAPDFAVLDLPYLVSDRTQVAGVLEGPIGKALLASLPAAGMRGLTFSEASFRGSFFKKPLAKPETLKGVKIRVPNSPAFIAAFQAFGSQPTPLPFPEVYSALQQGVVDGAENSLTTYFTYKYYEVAPHFYFTNHAIGPSVYVASEKFFSSLPASVKQIMLETAAEVGQIHRKMEWENSDRMVKEATAKGATFHEINTAPMQADARAVYKTAEGKVSPATMALVYTELNRRSQKQ
jgi:tripartite ATP-independent transporter DctP family solute receptor